MQACEKLVVGLCLTRPPADPGLAIFGFSEFLAALALLVLVYTSSDPIYRFRVAVAPLPLYLLTFFATLVIGISTLSTDLWFAERWLAPAWGVERPVIQASLGIFFLTVVSLWTWFAFIRPPVFGRMNAARYAQSLYRVVIRASDAELPAIANELGRSSAALIAYAPSRPHWPEDAPQLPTVNAYANDILLLIGSRKFCRHLVTSAPATAMYLFSDAAASKKWHVSLGAFAMNVTGAALKDTDSILYHEDGGYYSGLLGYHKPFSKAVFGDFQLVEGLGAAGGSPLDVDYRIMAELNGEQFATYCRLVLITLESYVTSGRSGQHSYALNRAVSAIAEAHSALYKLDGKEGVYSEPEFARLDAAVHFARDALACVAKAEGARWKRKRPKRHEHVGGDLVGLFADLIFDLIFASTSIKSPQWSAWSAQHNTVWSPIFSFTKDTAFWRAVRGTLFRLIFNEIAELEKWPNFKGARILAFCLNVFSLREPKRDGYGAEEYPLRKAVLNWTRRNYATLAKLHPPVAEACLIGGVTYDPDNRQLVKTYEQGLRLEPSREYVALAPPREDCVVQ